MKIAAGIAQMARTGRFLKRNMEKHEAPTVIEALRAEIDQPQPQPNDLALGTTLGH